MKEVKLVVRDAKKRDVGRGIARISRLVRKQLNVEIGDAVEISGKKQTVAIAWESYERDKNQKVIRIDADVRKNAGLSLGEQAAVHKILKSAEAEYLEIAPVDMRLDVDEDFVNFVRIRLAERVLIKGDTIPVLMLGHRIPFTVEKTRPIGIIRVTAKTELKILSNPASVSKPISKPPKRLQGNRKMAIPYEINLENLPTGQPEGAFNCPNCGTIISPEDKTDATYDIVETKADGDELQEITICCKKCGSKIDLIGFSYVPPRKEEIEKEYDRLKPLYKQLVQEVRFTLTNRLRENGIRTHSVKARVKEYSSFYDKIIRKKIEEDPFEVIDDIAAVRIICLYRKDLERIGNIIKRNFKILKSDTSRIRSEKHFGYMSDHYVVILHEEYRGARYDEIKHLRCEIQVRTTLMHAWASVSHQLDYKKEFDIPKNLRKDFYALSGLFYVADSHFETLREAVEQAKSNLMKSAQRNKFDLHQEIDLDNLRVYLSWRLPGRKTGNVDSALLYDIRNAGHRTFIDIEKRLNECRSEIEEKEKGKWGQIVFTEEDIIRISLGIAKPYYRQFLK